MSKRSVAHAKTSSRTVGADAARVRRIRLAALIIVVAGLLVYANGLRGPFVFDDTTSIVDNPSIRNLWPPGAVLRPPFADGQTVGGRPLLNLSFAINYAFSGLEVWSYHAVNLAVHLTGALLLFGLARRTLEGAPPASGTAQVAPTSPSDLGGPRVVATVVALMWCVHPMNTAAVTYVVQRAESLAGCLILLTLYAFRRAVEAHAAGVRTARGWSVCAVVACASAMATKETGAAAPLLVALYDRAYLVGSWREAWALRWRTYLACAATWLLLAGLVLSTGSRGGSAGFAVMTSRWDYLLTQAEALTRYLALTVWPVGLTFDYGTPIEDRLSAVWPQAVLLTVLLAVVIRTMARRPALGFPGAAAFLVLAPSSSVFPVTSQTMAEHRMYLPLAALSALATVTLFRFAPRRAVLVSSVLVLALGAVTVARNHDYRSAVSLWADTVAKRPDNARAHTNLGAAYIQAGNAEEATLSLQNALRIHPDHASAHYNLGVALTSLDRHGEALVHLGEAVRLEPTSADARVNLGNALVRAGRPAEAVAHYLEVLRLQPESGDAVLNLGLAYLAAGRPREAVAPLRRAVALLPVSVEARFALGNALVRIEAFPDAVDAYRDTLRLSPDHISARANLANALLVAGRTREAIGEYETVLRQRPGDPAIRANLEQARALFRRGSTGEVHP